MLDGSLMILIYSLALILCNLEERKIAKFIYTVTLFSAVQGLSYQSSFGKKNYYCLWNLCDNTKLLKVIPRCIIIACFKINFKIFFPSEL